jgi:hypothetical protein
MAFLVGYGQSSVSFELCLIFVILKNVCQKLYMLMKDVSYSVCQSHAQLVLRNSVRSRLVFVDGRVGPLLTKSKFTV